MNTPFIIKNIFSNWFNIIIGIVLAFFISPILIKQLGNEAYGIWVLIVSVTGYFTIVDFGINTALIRFLSLYQAAKNISAMKKVFSSSFFLYLIISIIFFCAISILSLYFSNFFPIDSFSKDYINFICWLVGLDLAINFIFTVYDGLLRAFQQFQTLNLIDIVFNILKNITFVILLLNGHSLLALASVQLASSLIKGVSKVVIIKYKYSFLKVERKYINRKALKELLNYSIFSFMIIFASKALFYSDSLIIGSLLTIEQVTFYSIAQMIMENLERLVWAAIAVLVPIISSSEVTGTDNKYLYLIGTRYSMIFCAPFMVVLFLVGDDFIGLWMGTEYIDKSGTPLKILLIGYLFSLCQLISHGILKGISRHKILAYILILQVLLNVLISMILAPSFGLTGIAIGTVIPLLLSNVFLIPYFTCKVLKMNYFLYMKSGLLIPLSAIFLPTLFLYYLQISVDNYWQLLVICSLVSFGYLLFTFFFILEKHHSKKAKNFIHNIVFKLNKV